mgnify:CR=1 FL=1
MKYLIGLLFLWGMIACSTDEIKTYSDRDYILFTKYVQDSTNFSFLSYPNSNKAELKLEVRVIGMPSDRDREYKISVMDAVTDAPADSYELPSKFVLKAKEVVDSCTVVLKKTAELSTRSRRLTLRLEETADFALGQTDRLAAIINISNVISKPQWWNAIVDKTWLGEYSDLKYELFIKLNNGKVDVDVTNTNEIRTCTLKLKNYLKQMKDNNQPVLEADGREMIVAYIGG